MLPCHGYPGLKKYPHLVGNYGGAWQDQHKEFAAFPGAILMTTNCIQKPTRQPTRTASSPPAWSGWPGVTHIADRNFTPVDRDGPGAARASPRTSPARTILVGFGRNAVLGVAGKVIDAVKAGTIRHFFLVGGCDGAKPGRNYYTEFAEQVPEGLRDPDAGLRQVPLLQQATSATSAASRACSTSASATTPTPRSRSPWPWPTPSTCGVNDLPLSLVLSWYEQKAVAILLTLLHLGIKNIRLGPSLPAFVTPERAERAGGEVQHHADHDAGGGPEGHPEVTPNPNRPAPSTRGRPRTLVRS